MSSIYLDNVEFYRNLLSTALSKPASEPLHAKSQPDTSDVADTTICTRIRPLGDEEIKENHITGILSKGDSSALLFEPRMKLNGTPDALVSKVFSLTK